MTQGDERVVTGRCGPLVVHLDRYGYVSIGIKGEPAVLVWRRDAIQPLIDALIVAQLEPLPRSFKRRWRRWLGYRFFEDRGPPPPPGPGPPLPPHPPRHRPLS